MIVLGIDPSLNATGLCINLRQSLVPLAPAHWTPGEDFQIKSVVHPDGLSSPQKWERIDAAIAEFAQHAEAVIIEGYSFGSMLTQARTAGEVGAIIRYRLHKMGFVHGSLNLKPIIEVAPTSLKKFILGTGKGEKNLVLKRVYQQYKVDLNDDNQADAFVLCQIGEAYFNKDISDIPKYQQEVLDTIRNPKQKKRRKA